MPSPPDHTRHGDDGGLGDGDCIGGLQLIADRSIDVG